MKILVTGANGFVGSTIVEKFVNDGHQVKCLVHKNLSWIKNLKVELSPGSITQPETLIGAVKNIDLVFHLAGVLRASNKETYYAVNHIGTKNLIEAVYKFNPNINRFVYISSQAAMGPSEGNQPKGPECVCSPVSDYGRSKLFGEEEVLKFKDRLPVTILRPAAVYGPRDKDLLPFFKFVAKGIFPILTGNSESYVQLLFVNDLAEICAIITKRKELNNRIYFLSEKKAYLWQEIGQTISKIADKKIRIIVLPLWLINSMAFISENFMKLKGASAALNRDKISEFCQKYWIGEPEATEKEFGFKFTKLGQGAKITYNWYKENKLL